MKILGGNIMKLTKFEIGLLIIPLVIAAIALYFLPSSIPIHWEQGKADGYGSKYFVILFALLPLIIYKYIKKRFWY